MDVHKIVIFKECETNIQAIEVTQVYLKDLNGCDFNLVRANGMTKKPFRSVVEPSQKQSITCYHMLILATTF